MFREQKITFAFFAGSLNLLGTLGTHDGSISDGGFDTIKRKINKAIKQRCAFSHAFSVFCMENMKTQQVTLSCSDVVLIMLILLILLTIITYN